MALRLAQLVNGPDADKAGVHLHQNADVFAVCSVWKVLLADKVMQCVLCKRPGPEAISIWHDFSLVGPLIWFVQQSTRCTLDQLQTKCSVEWGVT